MSQNKLEFDILPQPNEVTCGPTCLHALYKFYGDHVSLSSVISEVRMLKEGGTLAVLLALHALRRGYTARIYTYNLHVFDPSWFRTPDFDIASRLRRQMEIKKKNHKLVVATKAYLEFLRLGGELRFEDMRPSLIRRYLKRGIPILTGTSATYLYHESREMEDCTYDDVAGEPSGHFVVLSGYEQDGREVHVADPLNPNPVGNVHHYMVSIERVIGAILLGVLTYDANILIIEPPKEDKGS